MAQLDLSERDKHAAVYRLHPDLLRLRREDAVFRTQDGQRIQGAILADEAFLLRFFGENGDDRLMLVNLGRDQVLTPVAEPLLSPPDEDKDWRILWSSENPMYGGSGTGLLDTKNWHVPGHATIVLAPGV